MIFIFISWSVFIETLMPLTDLQHRFITITGSNGSVQRVDVVVNNFTWNVNEIVGHFSAGWWASIVVVGLAVYSLWTERNHDSGWFTLSGPVSKRQIIRVKYVYDLSLIAATFTFLALSLGVIDWILGIHYPLYGIFRWWVAELAIQCSMYGLSLLFGTLIGNSVVVALLAFAVSNVPMYIGIPLTHMLGANGVVYADPSKYFIPVSWRVMWMVTHLSPLNWFSLDFSKLWTSPWPYFIWFLLFTVLSCWVSERIYERTANERMSNFLAFKWLQHPVTLLASGVVAALIVKFTRIGHVMWTQQAAWIAVITLVLWGIVILFREKVASHF